VTIYAELWLLNLKSDGHTLQFARPLMRPVGDSTDRGILLLTLLKGLKPGEIAVRLALTSEPCERRSRAPSRKRLSRT
jgi:hypothetical protein